jgi:hypothetical protein
MKTNFKSAAVLIAFALLSTGAFAAYQSKTDTLTNEVTASVSYYENTAGVDVTIDKATGGASAITIYDAAGNVVLTDDFTIESASVQKSYLLNDLADGDYTIAVKTNNEVLKKTITLSSEVTDAQAFAF